MVKKQNVEMIALEFFVILLFLFGLYSCGTEKNNNIYEMDIEFVDRITEFPDSSFFSDVRMMEYENGKIYLLDVKRGDLVALSEDFKQMNVVAPHSEIDLVMPVSFNVENDTIYACDYGSVKTLKVYTDGNQIESMSSFRFNEKRMAMNDSFVWFSAPTDTSCYVRFDKKKPDCFTFGGKAQKEKNNRKTIVKNDRHFFLNDGMLYAVPDAYSFVERYNIKTGVLEESLDISDVPFVKENIQYAESQKVDDDSYFIYVMDACLYGDDLFLLCPSLGNPYCCNMLLKIELGGKEMQLAGYYELPGNVYRSICVSDEYLFAAYHGRDCAIEKYKLNEN